MLTEIQVLSSEPRRPSAVAPALIQLRERAEAGEAQAQFQLGVAFEEGRGVPANGRLAERWYRRAAEAGLGDAQLALGVIYAIGDGVDRDYAQAYVWFDLAAAQGQADAAELKRLVGRELGRSAREAAEAQARELRATLAA